MLSDERVQFDTTGQMGPELKTPWRDGATHVVMTGTVQAGPHPIGWARLLKRVFAIDMPHCPNCVAGELKIIAAILEQPVIEKILTLLGLDPQPPPRAPAREPARHQAV